MIRILPMLISGIICNALVALVIGHIDLMILIGVSHDVSPLGKS